MTEAPGTHNPNILPPNIPAPQDDGAREASRRHETA